MDLIKREDAILAMRELLSEHMADTAEIRLNELPSAEQEPISDAYAKAVLTWLIDYQIKAVELKGRYAPYEVLSWVANDWRKEHE